MLGLTPLPATPRLPYKTHLWRQAPWSPLCSFWCPLPASGLSGWQFSQISELAAGVGLHPCSWDSVKVVCHVAIGRLVKGHGYAMLYCYLLSLFRMEIKQIMLSEIALSPRDSAKLPHKTKSCSARNQSLSGSVGDWLLPRHQRESSQWPLSQTWVGIKQAFILYLLPDNREGKKKPSRAPSLSTVNSSYQTLSTHKHYGGQNDK